MHISITAFYLILQFLRIYSQDLAENENESEESNEKFNFEALSFKICV